MNNSFSNTQTESDFTKVHNKALFNSIQHLLNPKEASLISFNDIKSILKPKSETYEGMKVIPINKIVGSEGRYKDFDNHFFPKSAHIRTRWEHVDSAHLNNINLPAILVYELGGLYFVRDGNHRVSVAKASGVEFIDAEVVSLQSEIKLKIGTTLKDMVKQVIAYEKRVFYTETNFGDITDYWLLDFSTTGRYDEIYHHILTHKYYLNLNKDYEITLMDAINSWFNIVYMPVIQQIEKNHILRKFKHRTKSDLYVWIMKYWDEIKTKYGDDYSLDKVINDFSKKFGSNIFKKILNTIEHIIVKKGIK